MIGTSRIGGANAGELHRDLIQRLALHRPEPIGACRGKDARDRYPVRPCKRDCINRTFQLKKLMRTCYKTVLHRLELSPAKGGSVEQERAKPCRGGQPSRANLVAERCVRPVDALPLVFDGREQFGLQDWRGFG
jgi:hypothetical protein